MSHVTSVSRKSCCIKTLRRVIFHVYRIGMDGWVISHDSWLDRYLSRHWDASSSTYMDGWVISHDSFIWDKSSFLSFVILGGLYVRDMTHSCETWLIHMRRIVLRFDPSASVSVMRTNVYRVCVCVCARVVRVWCVCVWERERECVYEFAYIHMYTHIYRTIHRCLAILKYITKYT